jgi:GGDEF domain-containing protein
LTVTLTIVAVVVTSVLRAGRAPMRGYLRVAAAADNELDIVSQEAFRAALASLCIRASARGEAVAVTSVRLDDLDQISTAFGSEVAGSVARTWRSGVRRHAPTNAVVAQDGPKGLLVGIAVGSPQEARRQAAAIYRGLFDDLGRVGGGVIPVVGVGVALSENAGYDTETLIQSAREAAGRAAADVETSVLVDGGD